MRRAPQEIEVKARVNDPAALSRALRGAGATLEFAGEMVDRRFDRRGRLRRRDEMLRLRIYQPADGGAPRGVLAWKGAKRARGAYRARREWETPVADPEAARAILESLGYEVSVRIDRRIEQFALGAATIRIEWYPAMDVLVEVEGPPTAIERAVAATGLPRDGFLPQSLSYFLRAYERRTGRRARLAAGRA